MGRVRERVRERVMAALKEKSMSKRKQLAWLATLSEASAGALGQLFSTLLLYPLDTSKTRIQACLEENASKQNEEEEEEEEAQEITEIEEKQKKQKENWKEWALSLYTGIEAKAFQTLASQFLFFYTYEYIKRKLKSSGRQIQAFDNVLIGMLAGSVNVLITQPLDTYVTMKQSNVLQVKAPAEKSKPRLYAALGPSLFLSINPGIQYATFDQIKGFLTKERKNNTLTALEAFLLGAFSKCIATIVTYPAIRGKVVCQSVNGAKYSGLMDAMTKVVESEGSKGLYKGLPQQLTKTVLSAAIGLMLKEKISQAERTFAAMLLKMAKEKK